MDAPVEPDFLVCDSADAQKESDLPSLVAALLYIVMPN